jgi:3',5'-cyclic AMP phosphodiesterase CpdA
MFRLAHLSDPHLGPLPEIRWRELVSKRVLGYINWHRNRGATMKVQIIAGLMQDLAANGPDHIAVTGDLVNIALRAELGPARGFLDSLGKPEDVSCVPGNHDAYVPGALQRATDSWAPFMLGDGDGLPVRFPFVRRRGDVAIVGASSAHASAPFLATGSFSDKQRDAVAQQLVELRREGLFRVVLIHHPPIRGATEWHKRLIGGRRFRAMIAETGAELVLHGHTHLATKLAIPGPHGLVPVIGVPSASHGPGGEKPPAGYNLFEIERAGDGWNVAFVERGYNRGGTLAETGRQAWDYDGRGLKPGLVTTARR